MTPCSIFLISCSTISAAEGEQLFVAGDTWSTAPRGHGPVVMGSLQAQTRDKSKNGGQVLKKQWRTRFQTASSLFSNLGEIVSLALQERAIASRCARGRGRTILMDICNRHSVHHRDMAIYIGKQKNCSAQSQLTQLFFLVNSLPPKLIRLFFQA